MLDVSQAQVLRSKDISFSCLIGTDKTQKPAETVVGKAKNKWPGKMLSQLACDWLQILWWLRNWFETSASNSRSLLKWVMLARKPPRGETFGATYIREFQDRIAEMYQLGNVDKNAKVSPTQVAEQLKREHPNRFRLLRSWAV